ncbi:MULTISPECIES: hypothetical protein [unclassified Streptomyces]|uniref:hypothetical protein n=1 Tax=unclassified Streptomyces TaxID=2593676 RepID=UPI0033C5720E
MSTWIQATAFLLYLAGVGLYAHVWPAKARRRPQLQLAVDQHPIAVCLVLAIATVAWPALVLLQIVSHLVRRAR